MVPAKVVFPFAASVILGDQDGELIVPLEVYIFKPPPDIPSIKAVVCGSEAVPAKASAGVPVPFLSVKVFPPPSKVPMPLLVIAPEEMVPAVMLRDEFTKSCPCICIPAPSALNVISGVLAFDA